MRPKSMSLGSHLTMSVPRLDSSMYLQEMGKKYILWSGEEGSTNRCLQTESAIAAIAVSDNTIREMVRAYSDLVKFISWRHPPVRDLPRYLNHC